MIAVIGSLVFVPGCKRSDLADPDMHNNAGFFINLSGVANPGTLFVTQGGGWQNSYINMTARYNDGNPVAGKSIFMKINEEFGTFPGDKRTAVITTNSQGQASIRYSVSQLAIEQIGSELLILIQAWMQVDLYNVYDFIPLQLVTNMPDEDVNTLAYFVSGNYQSIPSIGGNFSVYLYNSTGSDPITYIVGITDTSMITSPANGTTGTTDSTVDFTVSENSSGSPRSTIVTITAQSPDDVLGSPISIIVIQSIASGNTFAATISGSTDIPASSGGNFSVYLYNSTGSDPINYRIDIIDTNSIIASPSTGTTGTTNNTEFFTVNPGTSGDTATITITATSPGDVAGQFFTFNVTLI